MRPSEEMYINGYIKSKFDKNQTLDKLLSTLSECYRGENLKEGFEFKTKYPNTFDLRPTVYEYDDVFMDILIDNQIDQLLYKATQKDLCLTHIQLRRALQGHSYMDWHRDTYFNNEKLIGPLPPSYKIIFYPLHGREPEPKLKILKGSAKCMNLGSMPNINLDQELLRLMQADTFTPREQFTLKYESMPEHIGVSNIFDSRRTI